VGPSSSWAPVLCTCCTVHCYATEAGCFLEKDEGGKNSKLVLVLELLEFIYEYEYSDYSHHSAEYWTFLSFLLLCTVVSLIVWLLYCLTALYANKRIYRTPVVISALSRLLLYSHIGVNHMSRSALRAQVLWYLVLLYWHLQYKNLMIRLASNGRKAFKISKFFPGVIPRTPTREWATMGPLPHPPPTINTMTWNCEWYCLQCCHLTGEWFNDVIGATFYCVLTSIPAISTAILGFSTAPSPKKLTPDDCDDDRQLEIAIWTFCSPILQISGSRSLSQSFG